MTLITQKLIRFAKREFQLDWHGIHGAPHWSRVRHNGLILAELTGANTHVIEYFSFIHDMGRENDNHDPEHGYRAASIAQKIAGDLIQVTDQELALLMEACTGHSDGHLMADVTVIAVRRELQKSQNTSPENRQAYSPASGGRPASEASPNPAGSMYAANVMPATTSPRSQAGL